MTGIPKIIWRVGRKLGRTLYRGDVLVGLIDTPEMATLIVDAMNSRDPASDIVLASPSYEVGSGEPVYGTCAGCGLTVEAIPDNKFGDGRFVHPGCRGAAHELTGPNMDDDCICGCSLQVHDETVEAKCERCDKCSGYVTIRDAAAVIHDRLVAAENRALVAEERIKTLMKAGAALQNVAMRQRRTRMWTIITQTDADEAQAALDAWRTATVVEKDDSNADV